MCEAMPLRQGWKLLAFLICCFRRTNRKPPSLARHPPRPHERIVNFMSLT
jgi:hypothetical protein